MSIISHDIVVEAAKFAYEAHHGQTHNGKKYTYHTVTVAYNIGQILWLKIAKESWMLLIDPYKNAAKLSSHDLSLPRTSEGETVLTWLLHDTEEDSLRGNAETRYRLKSGFWKRIQRSVHQVSSDKEMVEYYGKNEYLVNKILALPELLAALKIGADRRHNTMDVEEKSLWSPSQRKRAKKYFDGTMYILYHIMKWGMTSDKFKKLISQVYWNIKPAEKYLYKTIA